MDEIWLAEKLTVDKNGGPKARVYVSGEKRANAPEYVWSDWEFLFSSITQNTAKPSCEHDQFDCEHLLKCDAVTKMPMKNIYARQISDDRAVFEGGRQMH